MKPYEIPLTVGLAFGAAAVVVTSWPGALVACVVLVVAFLMRRDDAELERRDHLNAEAHARLNDHIERIAQQGVRLDDLEKKVTGITNHLNLRGIR